MFCPLCGSHIEMEASNFCPYCGQPLDTVWQQKTVAQSTASRETSFDTFCRGGRWRRLRSSCILHEAIVYPCIDLFAVQCNRTDIGSVGRSNGNHAYGSVAR